MLCITLREQVVRLSELMPPASNTISFIGGWKKSPAPKPLKPAEQRDGLVWHEKARAKQTLVCSTTPYRSKSYAANASGSVVVEEGCHPGHFLQTLKEAKRSNAEQVLIKEFRFLVKAFIQWVSKMSSSRGSDPDWEKNSSWRVGSHFCSVQSPDCDRWDGAGGTHRALSWLKFAERRQSARGQCLSHTASPTEGLKSEQD